MHISLQKCHVFYDGNKRTSLGLFQILLNTIGYFVVDEIELVDYQILFIENEITKEEFKMRINKLLDSND